MILTQKKDSTPFVYGSSSSPSSFDPLGAYDTTSGEVINNVFEGLYAVDYNTDEIVPQLADKAHYSESSIHLGH